MHYTHKYRMNTYVFRQYILHMFNAFCTRSVFVWIFSKMTSRCLFSYFTSTWYMYFYCDALYFIWEWQSIFMMYSMCLLYILCLRFAQWWNVLFSHCQKPTAKLAYYAFLSWANSIELFLISYKFHYMFWYSLWAQLIL